MGMPKLILLVWTSSRAKKYEEMCPTSHNMDVPRVQRVEDVLSMLDETSGQVSVLDVESGKIRSDLNLPTFGLVAEPTDEDLRVRNQIVDAYKAEKNIDVVVISACGEEKIVGAKVTD